MTDLARPPYDPQLVPVLEVIVARLAETGVRPDMDLSGATPDVIASFRQPSPSIQHLLAAHDIRYTEHIVDGVTLAVYTPKNAQPGSPCIYNIHGGGMILGDRFAGFEAEQLAWILELGAIVVSVEYRLAPEYPAPAPGDDCRAGLKWVVDNADSLGIDVARILVAGSSAGGGLAASLALRARDESGPAIAAMLLIAPMLDDRDDTLSTRQYAAAGGWDRPLNQLGWTALLGQRVGGRDVSPYEVPARASDLHGLPPMYIEVGSAELFRDESVAFASSVWASGGIADLHVWAGGYHGYASSAAFAHVSIETVAARIQWMKRVLGKVMLDAIRPGAVWLDTNGNRIQAHGGSIFHEDGVFYWYGENKERTTPGNGIWHWGIRCYSSTDLYNWEDRGLIIPPIEDDANSPLHPSRMVDRPHIIRNPRTGKYVCWIKVMGGGNTQLSTILTADSLLGPYEIERTDLRPLGMNAGDFDLVVEPTDGKAYYYFERVHSELICADLSDDYTDVTGHYSTHFPRVSPPDVREAPAYFRRDGKHYLVTSGTTWYLPNPSEVAVAASFHGPFTMLGDPHRGDTSTSFRSQISSVFKHPAKRDLYIALADRWLPHLSEAESNQVEAFRAAFAGGGAGEAAASALPEANTSIADYVWLPISFEDGMPVIEWHDEWRVEDFE